MMHIQSLRLKDALRDTKTQMFETDGQDDDTWIHEEKMQQMRMMIGEREHTVREGTKLIGEGSARQQEKKIREPRSSCFPFCIGSHR